MLGFAAKSYLFGVFVLLRNTGHFLRCLFLTSFRCLETVVCSPSLAIVYQLGQGLPQLQETSHHSLIFVPMGSGMGLQTTQASEVKTTE